MLHTICMRTGRRSRFLALFSGECLSSRIWDEKRNVILADCEDDGETAASSRMLHLMDVS
jgi:hypothetical protein